MFWSQVLHAAHVLLAGLWAGGLFFTATVVSPAFKRMAWSPTERIAVRSEVGRQYSRVARLNLAALLAAAVADWLTAGGGVLGQAEWCLIVVVAILAELHARYFAPLLAAAARRGDDALRARVLRVSISVSMLNLALSFAIVALSSLRNF